MARQKSEAPQPPATPRVERPRAFVRLPTDQCTFRMADHKELVFPHAWYSVNVDWTHIEDWIISQEDYRDIFRLNLDPDYQRAHVWTLEQKRDYVEYVLRGGEVSKTLVFSAVGRSFDSAEEWKLTDGKQRLSAVREFMAGAFGVFADEKYPQGHKANAIADINRIAYGFIVQVVMVERPSDELKLYLSINTRGTPHNAEEIARVRAMLDKQLALEANS